MAVVGAVTVLPNRPTMAAATGVRMAGAGVEVEAAAVVKETRVEEDSAAYSEEESQAAAEEEAV